jgi:hypothetical protein
MDLVNDLEAPAQLWPYDDSWYDTEFREHEYNDEENYELYPEQPKESNPWTIEKFYEQVLTSIPDWSPDQQKTICRWMKTNNARIITGHQKQFTELLRELGFLDNKFSLELRRALRDRTSRKINNLALCLRRAGALKVSNKDDSRATTKGHVEVIEFVDWTDTWLEGDWDGKFEKPWIWDTQNPRVPDKPKENEPERFEVESPKAAAAAERREADLGTLRALSGAGVTIADVGDSVLPSTEEHDVSVEVAHKSKSPTQPQRQASSVVELDREESLGDSDTETETQQVDVTASIQEPTAPRISSWTAINTKATSKDVIGKAPEEEKSLGETDSETETEEDTLNLTQEETAPVKEAPTSEPPSTSLLPARTVLNTQAQSRVIVDTDPEGEERLGEEDTETEADEDTHMNDTPATSFASTRNAEAATTLGATQYEIPSSDDESLGDEDSETEDDEDVTEEDDDHMADDERSVDLEAQSDNESDDQDVIDPPSTINDSALEDEQILRPTTTPQQSKPEKLHLIPALEYYGTLSPTSRNSLAQIPPPQPYYELRIPHQIIPPTSPESYRDWASHLRYILQSRNLMCVINGELTQPQYPSHLPHPERIGWLEEKLEDGEELSVDEEKEKRIYELGHAVWSQEMKEWRGKRESVLGWMGVTGGQKLMEMLDTEVERGMLGEEAMRDPVVIWNWLGERFSG